MNGPTIAARPTRPRPGARIWVVLGVLITYTVFAGRQVGFDISTFWNVWSNPLWEKFWPVPWDWVLDWHNVLDPLLETFQIAVVATLVGCGLALPLAIASSPPTSPHSTPTLGTRLLIHLCRPVPLLFRVCPLYPSALPY